MGNLEHSAGHLFVINSDLTRLQCDALLVPTDQAFKVETAWERLITRDADGGVTRPAESDWLQGAAGLQHTDSHGRDIWLGNVGGTPNTDPATFAEAAANFVKAAASKLAGRTVRGELPTVALPLLGSGAGGGRNRKGQILEQMIPTLQRVAREHSVDVVLVVWGRATFEQAQAVRRAVHDQLEIYSHLSEQQQQSARAVAQQAIAGNLVVFVGAGVSATAGLPAWQALLDGVARGLNYDDEQIAQLHALDQRDQAQVLQQHSPETFAASVRERLSSAHFSLVHGLLTSLPVREFVTTNFDTLLEAAAGSPGNKLDVIPGASITSSSRWLVKLHGTLEKDLVLTRAEYRDGRHNYGALFGLLQALLFTKHMLFVGYSLKDEDFNDVIHEVRTLVNPDKNSTGSERKIGTAFVTVENQQFAKLWPELTVTAAMTSGRGLDDPDEKVKAAFWKRAGRNLALYLDLVAVEATSEVAASVDKSLVTLASSTSGAALREVLVRLREVYLEHCDETGTASSIRWAEVRSFLDSIGMIQAGDQS